MAPKPKVSRNGSHRSTLSLQKIEIFINIYDLLPPGKIATFLWTFGSSLLHSAVVINGREYAYGGHDKRGQTGVYWTAPRQVPPGGTFKCEILHGFTVRPQAEVDAIITDASDAFQGTAYNLLSKNCNHFTQYLCGKLTGRSGPAWLNRAASIGIALPCVVPKEWIAPPDFESAEGALIDGGDDTSNENSRMLIDTDRRHSMDDSRSVLVSLPEDEEILGEDARQIERPKKPVRDTSGRIVHPADIAPVL
ncbi:PPPDE putative peptidase domain-containing protein [Calycina marina]|uniref:PPPDE putative peptidase domain-containing protein n=1 Tax=Calycina marina TaxID=1763456 RepID=A0A9P8CI71_9HELO|nr:PPPDE putative peptidase domain-containing protein [Calycina marina]